MCKRNFNKIFHFSNLDGTYKEYRVVIPPSRDHISIDLFRQRYEQLLSNILGRASSASQEDNANSNPASQNILQLSTDQREMQNQMPSHSTNATNDSTSNTINEVQQENQRATNSGQPIDIEDFDFYTTDYFGNMPPIPNIHIPFPYASLGTTHILHQENGRAINSGQSNNTPFNANIPNSLSLSTTYTLHQHQRGMNHQIPNQPTNSTNEITSNVMQQETPRAANTEASMHTEDLELINLHSAEIINNVPATNVTDQHFMQIGGTIFQPSDTRLVYQQRVYVPARPYYPGFVAPDQSQYVQMGAQLNMPGPGTYMLLPTHQYTTFHPVNYNMPQNYVTHVVGNNGMPQNVWGLNEN